MSKFIVIWRAPLLTAALFATLTAYGLSGCSKKPAQEQEQLSEMFRTPEPPEPPPETSVFTDDRDAEVYKTAKIGGQTWLAENLRYRSNGSWCYGDDSANCGKYGRLYAWEAATTVCPAGWHLPTRLEWAALSEAAGGEEVAGKRLKAASGWDEDGNGTDSRGFSALPGGSRHYSAGDFSYAGSIGFWWTSTEYGGDGNAYIRTMSHGDNDVGESYGGKGGGMSVRCVQN